VYWRNYEIQKINEKFNAATNNFLLSDWKFSVCPFSEQYFLLYFKIHHNEQGN
jgi:hypothetical protein